MMRRIFFGLLFLFFCTISNFALSAELYVSQHNGNDAWSGRYPQRQISGSDGPVQTLARAQELWRKAQAQAKTGETITVNFQGLWSLNEPIVLTEQDRRVPITFQVYANSKAAWLGSVVLKNLTWKSATVNGVQVWEAELSKEQVNLFPPVAQLFEGQDPLIRARYPDFDKGNPYQGGFLYAARGMDKSGKLGGAVGCIHNPGDSLAYDVDIPAAGKYSVWMLYAASNGSYNVQDVGNRMTIELIEPAGDKKAKPLAGPVALSGLTNTGSWNVSRWAKCAQLDFPAGKAQFKWTNVRGGGINIGGFILTQNDSWDPSSSQTLEEPTGQPTIIIPAESYAVGIGKQLTVTGSGSKDAFRAKIGDLKASWAKPDAELHIFQSGSCRAFKEIVGIKSIDETTGAVLLTGKECIADLAKGDRYYLENNRDFISQPGEWYMNRETGVLTVCSLNGKTAPKHLHVAVSGTLIQALQEDKSATNLAPVVVSGLIFAQTAHTRDDGCIGYKMGERGVVELDKTSGVTIRDCGFTNCGRYAVRINGGEKNAVERCIIQRSAQGGVLIIDSADNRVSDCSMEHLGLEYKHIGGVVLEKDSTRNLVSHNYIIYSSRYGISMKNAGKENIIEFNHVQETSLETFDTGAIEVTQQNKTQLSGSIIRNNRVINTNGYSCQGPDMPRRMSWGIYLDSFAGGYLVENNYVYGTSHGGFMFQGGKGNVLRNNIFRCGTNGQGHFSNFMTNSENLVFDHNIVTFENPEAALFQLGRELKTAVKSADFNTIFFRNAAEKPGENGFNPHTVLDFPGYKAWKALGFDEHGLTSDPQFVHPERHDGLLNLNSPTLKSGFQQLDLSTVGPRKSGK